MKRRTLIIILVSLTVVIGLAVWFYVQSTRTQEVSEDGVVTQVLGTEDVRLRLTAEDVASGKTIEEKRQEILAAQDQGRQEFEDVAAVTVRKIIDERVAFATLSQNKEKILFFNKDEGEFFQSDLNGENQERITNAGFVDLVDVKWSSGKQSAVLTFAASDGVERLISFNFSDQTFNDLGSNVAEAAISPDGNEIVYLFEDEENNVSNISSAAADGSKWKILQPYGNDTIDLEWTSPFRFLVGEEPTSYTQTSLGSLSVTGDDAQTIVADAFGLTYKVSPDGNTIIYTVGSSRSDEVYLYATDINGSFHQDLEIATMAHKCAFAEDNITVFCGVPQRGNLDYVVPDDYLEGNMVTNDSFYQINTQTGDKQRLGGASEFGAVYDIFNPVVSPTGRSVFFKRQQDENMYALILP
jgi:hypothetical protein